MQLCWLNYMLIIHCVKFAVVRYLVENLDSSRQTILILSLTISVSSFSKNLCTSLCGYL